MCAPRHFRWTGGTAHSAKIDGVPSAATTTEFEFFDLCSEPFIVGHCALSNAQIDAKCERDYRRAARITHIVIDTSANKQFPANRKSSNDYYAFRLCAHISTDVFPFAPDEASCT